MEQIVNHDLDRLLKDRYIVGYQGNDKKAKQHYPDENNRGNYYDTKEIFTLEKLLLKKECDKFIKQTEKLGYGRTDYDPTYRNNLRLQVSDQNLADNIFERIKAFKTTYNWRLDELMPEFIYENGIKYKLLGLNDLWRFSKYREGDFFKEHIDDCYYADNDNIKSMYSVNIYLNGSDYYRFTENKFIGGKTKFNFYEGDEIKNSLTIEPEYGKCLIFRQPDEQLYFHQGEIVEEGVKYLMRTDILYKKV